MDDNQDGRRLSVPTCGHSMSPDCFQIPYMHYFIQSFGQIQIWVRMYPISEAH